MKRLFFLFIILQLVACAYLQNTAVYKTPNISGHWKLVDTELVEYIPFLDQHALKDATNIAVEAYPYEFAFNTDLIFKEDSFYQLNYPIKLFGTGKYSLEASDINFIKQKWPINVEVDTMLIYRNDEWNHFQKLVYHRAIFNDSIVSILKRDTLNYAALEGTWMLERDYNYNYGMEYILDFSHEIPDSIVLTKEQILARLHIDRSVEFLTDGKKRKYTLSYKDKQLHLTPKSWYNGEDPMIHFSRK